MNSQIERRLAERRLNIDRRQTIDLRYEDPEFHLIEKRANRERRRVERRKGGE